MKTKYFLLAAALCLIFSISAHAQTSAELTVEPRVINVDALFNGTNLRVTGKIPADSDVVLRFLGASCDLHLKQKGKVFGLMWMNLDSLVFNHVPSVCIVDAAELPDAESGKKSAVESLSLNALKDSVQIESNGPGHESAFDELIKLKKEEGLYREVSGNIAYGPPSDGAKMFIAEIPVPSRLTPGEYVMEMSAVRGGSVVSRSTEPVSVKLVGAPAFLANLAFGHSALYGILATIIALLGGLAIGAIFQSKGSH